METYSSLSIEELARRCSTSGDVAAWEEFVRRLHRLIAKVVVRTAFRLGDSSRQTVDDLIQDTYLKFCADKCRIFRDFDHRRPGAFLGFVQVVAANVVRDHFRSSYARTHLANRTVDSSDENGVAAAEDAEGGVRAIEREVLIGEVDQCLEQCVVGPDRDRNIRIFWLYYRAGLTANAIAGLPGTGLTTKGVESLIQRMTRDLRERMAAPNPGVAGIEQGGSEGILPAETF